MFGSFFFKRKRVLCIAAVFPVSSQPDKNESGTAIKTAIKTTTGTVKQNLIYKGIYNGKKNQSFRKEEKEKEE